jgi:hypothetical protein
MVEIIKDTKLDNNVIQVRLYATARVIKADTDKGLVTVLLHAKALETVADAVRLAVTLIK